MSAPLYNSEILRLAANIPHHHRLAQPDATVERRSPTCGSRVTVDVRLREDGALGDLGMEVRACALGQASAALMAGHAPGLDGAALDKAAGCLRALLLGESDDTDFWPGVAVLARARDYPARHPSILLAFDAVAEAVRLARSQGAAA
ncbi:iron-sulfur cluster assembly scaffold protein [Sphingobium subterraneum]|uniref:NifU-like protein involved in Fe-S cluster formation n=1 Tax=Sphingobium subterraneum TaxID=627688 RepID=A0A841J2R7_9SPHN|nr:iron-sulfur cluster assembly scaffold protein [Sphingobium subterraneum]MBB6122601.1 NifU-like protein involved in Fe-S cluster formation [Sphingobium subterraneum]